MDSTDYDELEKKLEDPTAPPISLPLKFLNRITCNFSPERELGRGGFWAVYKGVLQSKKIIAVKKLFVIHMEDNQFQNEVSYLMGIRHQNIVQLVAYCTKTKCKTSKLPNGKYVMAEMSTRLLCFEYMCNGGLDKYVTDESSGLNWSKRYDIIKGICSGLHFLHGDCHIVHLDLKTQNILMDATMVPKIADFGLSRLLGEEKSRTIISGNFAGSLGYMAPEYLHHGIVSQKADIFSLGVIIIEIITGCKVYRRNFDDNDSRHSIQNSLQKFIDMVTGKWSNIFRSEPKHISPEIYAKQVKQCLTIALQCVDHDLEKRPNARDIFELFSALDTTNCHARDCNDSLVHEVIYEAESQASRPVPVISDEAASLAEPQSMSNVGKENEQYQSENASSELQSTSADKELENPRTEIIKTEECSNISSMNVHPEEPWIITHYYFKARIWDYNTQVKLAGTPQIRTKCRTSTGVKKISLVYVC